MMPSRGSSQIFLERRTYRQRRLRDVARMLPVLGTVLWLLPIAWRDGPDTTVTGFGTALTGLYVFGVWLVLIVLAGLVAALLRPEDEPPDRTDPGTG